MNMHIFFELTSYKRANGKWIPRYHRIIQSGATTNEQENFWNIEFDTKEEADIYAEGYCLQQGYIPLDQN